MGKSGADRGVFQRMNYLYQIAHEMLKINPHNIKQARFYTHLMKTIAKRHLLKIDPSIKRTLCKKCSMLLIPGVSASVRMKGKPEKYTCIRCLDCGTVKRFPNDKDYKLWCEQPEAWLALQQQQQEQPEKQQQKQPGKQKKQADTMKETPGPTLPKEINTETQNIEIAMETTDINVPMVDTSPTKCDKVTKKTEPEPDFCNSPVVHQETETLSEGGKSDSAGQFLHQSISQGNT